MIQFDKYLHPVALYENYLICIFININENLKMRENPLDELASPGGNQTYIEHLGHLLLDVYLFNGTTLMQKVLSSKINAFW